MERFLGPSPIAIRPLPAAPPHGLLSGRPAAGILGSARGPGGRSRLASLALLAALPLLAGCTEELVCTADQAVCDGQCASLRSDPANCGECGRACGAGQSCQAGRCCEGSLCPPALYAACFNNATVQGATADLQGVGAPVEVESGPISLAWDGATLWVANSISNTLDGLGAAPAGLAPVGPLPSLAIPPAGPFNDLEFVAAWNGLLYVSNAAVGSVVVVDPALVGVAGARPILDEIDLGPGAFPQGMAFSGGKGYVALNGTDRIAVLDLAARTVTGSIDLAALASPGGRALPSRLLSHGSRLYATLWNLDTTWSPAGPGRLAVIDTSSDALVPGVNPLVLATASGAEPECLNPAGLALRGATLYVTCGFFPYDSPTVTGAAIVPVDVSGSSPRVLPPLVLEGSTPGAGAAPGAIAFCGDVAYAGDRASGRVLRYDPALGAVTGQGELCVPRPGGSGYVADVACGR
jgi:hypothetical protein